jgi:hypothetical protein
VRIHLTDDRYIAALVAEAAYAAQQISAADSGAVADLSSVAARERARWSLSLDASPLTAETADAVDEGRWLGPQQVAVREPALGGWAAALRVEGMATQDVAAVEYANLRAAHAAELDVAALLFEQPLEALRRLHGIMCQGLVEPEVIGRPRRTAQAVHDGAQGWVIFNAPEPDAIPGLLAQLEAWLHGEASGLPSLAVAAVVHEALLEWQPFEAANGRLARSVAATVLRALAVDEHALAVPDRQFAANPGVYFREIAATRRRRGDLTRWVQLHAEAAVAGLQEAARALGVPPGPPPPLRAVEMAAAMSDRDTVTVPEYAERVGVSRSAATEELLALSAAGITMRDFGTQGLRFRKVTRAVNGHGRG